MLLGIVGHFLYFADSAEWTKCAKRGKGDLGQQLEKNLATLTLRKTGEQFILGQLLSLKNKSKNILFPSWHEYLYSSFLYCTQCTVYCAVWAIHQEDRIGRILLLEAQCVKYYRSRNVASAMYLFCSKLYILNSTVGWFLYSLVTPGCCAIMMHTFRNHILK